jgi:chromosome segregation ATPase
MTPGGRSTAGIISVCMSIIVPVGGGAAYIGGKIYDFSKAQTSVLEHLKNAQEAITGLKVDIGQSTASQDRSREALKNDIVPRIDKLESTVVETKTEAAAAKARLEDFKETLDEVKSLGQANLAVSQSHTPDIRATRRALGVTLPGDTVSGPH